jgi:phage-related protein
MLLVLLHVNVDVAMRGGVEAVDANRNRIWTFPTGQRQLNTTCETKGLKIGQ